MENKICCGGKRYCVLCSNSQGQILENGTKISLHCLPGGSSKEEIKRRSIWIQRIKLVRPNAPISSNTRLCNLHFEGNTCTKLSVPIHMDLSKAKKKKSFYVVPFFDKNGMKIITVKSLTISPLMIMMTVLLFIALH